MPPIRWQPDRTIVKPPWPVPSLATALGRGFMGRCPACGQTRLFDGFLTVREECDHCHAPLGLARADDAPPYFTILIVLGSVSFAACFLPTWRATRVDPMRVLRDE